MMRPIFLGAWLLLALPCVSRADGGRFEITPYGAYSFGGTFRDEDAEIEAKLRDSASAGLIMDWQEGPNTQWEILYSQLQTDADIEGLTTSELTLDITTHYLQVGGTYHGDGEKVRPYLAATIGAAHFDVGTAGYESDTFVSFSIGPGLRIRPNERLGLRLEARVFGTFVRSDSDLFCVSDPGGGTAGCAISASGDVLWQLQTIAGIVFRF